MNLNPFSLAEDAAVTAVGGGPLVVVRRLIGAVPLWAWVALAIGLAFAWEAYQAHRWHSRAVVAETSLASVKAVTLAVNKAATANKVRVETAQTSITKESDHATVAALDSVQRDYATLRLRYAALAGRRQPGAVPGVPESPGVAVDAACAPAALPSAELIDFAEQGDEWRELVVQWQSWYAKQSAIDRAPPLHDATSSQP